MTTKIRNNSIIPNKSNETLNVNSEINNNCCYSKKVLYIRIMNKWEKQEYKKYMVFGWDGYYPTGALMDCRDSFDEEQQALDFADTLGCDYIEIYNRIDNEILDII